MRSKHGSLLAVSLSVLAVAAAIWIEVSRPRGEDGRAAPMPSLPLSQVKAPQRSELEKMDFFERRMHLLAAPPKPVRSRADLSALGYLPVDHARPDNNGVEATVPEYRLSLAFKGPEKRYCIIDDRLYAEGAVLPDGATIVRIESRRVLIDKESLRKWVDIGPLLKAHRSEES
jgi:hypothetical protein